MEPTTVTSKGQVTIPKQLRQQMDMRAGSRIEFVVVGEYVEIRVAAGPSAINAGGFGMLKSRRAAVPADFDPTSCSKDERARHQYPRALLHRGQGR